MPATLAYAAAEPITDVIHAYRAMHCSDQDCATYGAEMAAKGAPALTPPARRILRWLISMTQRSESPALVATAAEIAAAVGRPPMPVERAAAALGVAEAAGWLVLARDGDGEVAAVALDLRPFSPSIEEQRATWEFVNAI